MLKLFIINILPLLSNSIISKTCNTTCSNEYYNSTISINCSVPPYFCSCWCNTQVGPVCSCMDNRPINYSYTDGYMKNNFTKIQIENNFTSKSIKNKNYFLMLFLINIFYFLVI